MPKCPASGSPRSARRSLRVVLLLATLVGGAVSTPGCRSTGAGVVTQDAAGDAGDAAGDRAASVDADCSSPDASSALCPITSCGYLKSAATIGLSETPQAGADSLC